MISEGQDSLTSKTERQKIQSILKTHSFAGSEHGSGKFITAFFLLLIQIEGVWVSVS